MPFWAPQVGPQLKAATCPADFTFFGGSRGGGKSDCLIGRQLRGAELYGNHWNGLVIRRKYKDFSEIRRRCYELIAQGLPAELIGGDQQTNYLRFKNGAQASMPAVGRIEQVNDFVGAQYTEIALDECTTFPFFSNMVDKLKGSNRSPHGVPCHMFGTGNPGGPGHLQVKEYFKLGTNSGVKPGTVFHDKLGESRVFIPSFLDDNKILCDNDPKYVNRLKSISDPLLRKAWIDGDWDVFIGQAFGFGERHILDDLIPVPENAPLYMTYDWGFGAPFSIGWWWVDNDNRIYRFSEWYGWDAQSKEGLRWEDPKVAEGIHEHERSLGITGRQITRLAGHDCWNKKADYRGGGQGPGTAEVFSGYGIHMSKGDSNRELKIRAFRDRLAIPKDENEMPMLMVYPNCKNFIRTIPSLAMGDTDGGNVEDLDSGQEDHVYDEACHICMARPVSMSFERPKISATDKRLNDLYRVKSFDGGLQEHLEYDQGVTDNFLSHEMNWDVDDGALISTL